MPRQSSCRASILNQFENSVILLKESDIVKFFIYYIINAINKNNSLSFHVHDKSAVLNQKMSLSQEAAGRWLDCTPLDTGMHLTHFEVPSTWHLVESQ